MPVFMVNWERCPGCTECAARKVCTTRAIVWLEAGEPTYIDPLRCQACGKCLHACLNGAIEQFSTGTSRSVSFS